MEDRKMLFRVGLMVTLTLIVTAIFIVYFGNMSKWIFGGEYPLEIRFKQAPGVSEGTPVRKSGIRIGYVKNVAMDPENTKIITTVEIQDKWKLYTNEVCRAQTNLMGDAYLEFVPRPNAPLGELIKRNTVLKGESPVEPMQMMQNVQGQFTSTISSVHDTSESFRGTSEDLGQTLRRINEMLDQNKEGINTAITRANKILADTQDIVGDPEAKRNLSEAIKELPEMIRDTKETVKSMQKNLHNVEDFTANLNEKGPKIIANLEKGSRNLNALVSDLGQFTEKLNNSEGTIGLLMNDPQLYQHLNHAAKNIDEIVRELKPIKDDLRVFTDKIARHPEDLGAKGIFEKKAGIK